jgi:murein lipoprotein
MRLTLQQHDNRYKRGLLAPLNILQLEETQKMSKVLLALTSAALLSLAGCASTSEPAAKSAAAAPTTISAEAQAALSAAQADVKAAKAKNALWTTSVAALEDAEEAAKKGDSATVIKKSKWASEQVKLSLAQLNYPELKVGQ